MAINPMFRVGYYRFYAADGGATGGDGGTASAGTATGVGAGVPDLQTKGAKNPLADVKYGIQTDVQNADAQETAQTNADTTADPKPDRNAEFEKLIKGEYKDLYDKRVQDTIKNRLKGTKETVDKYNALTDSLALLAKRYGVDPTDSTALASAIQNDDSFFEEEAIEKGIPVEQLKEIRKIERENASLKAQMQEANRQKDADRIFSDWMNQSEKLKSVYPNFDFDTEIQNPKFAELLKSNIDVRTAFEVIHKDEIIPAAMQYTAQQVRSNLSKSMMANASRPAEGGNGGISPAVIKSDVSQLSKADREEIARRVARGEKIRF